MSPLLCAKCGRQILPGTQVRIITAEDPVEVRILTGEEPLVVHDVCPT